MKDKNTIGSSAKIIEDKFISLLKKEDQEKILYALRKVSEDLNDMELWFTEIQLTPQQNIRMKQFINNNKKRIITIIWGLHGSGFRELDEIKK